MADRICPFCGTPNPEDAESCQHCQARLLSNSNPLPIDSESGNQDLSTWLDSTREEAAKNADYPFLTSKPATEEASQEETPDWLARIRERSRVEKDAENAAESFLDTVKSSAKQSTEKSTSKKVKTKTPQDKKQDENQKSNFHLDETPPFSDESEKARKSSSSKTIKTEEGVENLDEKTDSPRTKSGKGKDGRGLWVKPFHTADLRDLGNNPDLESAPQSSSKKSNLADQHLKERQPDEIQPSEKEPSGSISSPDEEPIPDWLEELESTFPPPEPSTKKDQPQKEVPRSPMGKTPSEEATPALPGDIPDWLKAAIPTTQKKSQPSTPAFFPGDVEEINPPPRSQKKPSPIKPAKDEGLTPAQLPGWLQALRPVESVLSENLPTSESKGVTGSGALAGLADVIPVQEEVGTPRKPSIPTSKLRVDDRQKVQAQLLDSVLHEGGQPVRITKPAQEKGKTAGRILISLLMVILLAVPIVIGSNSRLTPSPGFFAPETVSMATEIQALARDSRVLVILDYQPSLSGELQIASLPVIQHLMAQNAGLAFISTAPAGPILVNSLVQTAINASPGFDSSQRLVNLGYLPGGAIGLQVFAAQPRYVAPLTWTRLSAWANPMLQAVEGLKDFNAVLILTESAETARIWIEQVLPTIAQVPTYLVISQQSAALLLPYYNSSQLKGMISGITGGRMYELLISKEGASLPLWDSYQIGVVFIFVIILLGGIISSVSASSKKPVPEDKEEFS
jgi:hypothetical protein